MSKLDFWQILSFWVWSQFKKIFSSQIEFLIMVSVLSFEFSHNLSFLTIWVFSQLEFWIFVTISVFKFCHNFFVIFSDFVQVFSSSQFNFCHQIIVHRLYHIFLFSFCITICICNHLNGCISSNREGFKTSEYSTLQFFLTSGFY